jgi:hypothetical protein
MPPQLVTTEQVLRDTRSREEVVARGLDLLTQPVQIDVEQLPLPLAHLAGDDHGLDIGAIHQGNDRAGHLVRRRHAELGGVEDDSALVLPAHYPARISVSSSLLVATMNQKSSLREVLEFVSWVLTGNTTETKNPDHGSISLPHAFARGGRRPKTQSDFLFQGHDHALRRAGHFDAAPCRRSVWDGIWSAEGFINADRVEMRRLATGHVD